MFNLYYNTQRYEGTVELLRVTSIVLRTNVFRLMFANANMKRYAYLKRISPDFHITCHSCEWAIAPILQNEIFNIRMPPLPVLNDTVLGVIDKNRSIAFNGILNEKNENYG